MGPSASLPNRGSFGDLVVFQQVLPANLLRLVLLTSRRAVMGRLVNARVTTVVAGLATAVIVVLDVFLLVDLFPGTAARIRSGQPLVQFRHAQRLS